MDYLLVEYNDVVKNCLQYIKQSIKDIDEDLLVKIFSDGYRDLFLEIDINKKNLNEIHIMNGLPNFMKNLGIGKKIISNIIEKYHYIHLSNMKSTSFEFLTVFDSIVKDDNYYIFKKSNSILFASKKSITDKDITKIKKYIDENTTVDDTWKF